MEEHIPQDCEQKSVLKRPVSDFPLSVRTENILRRHEITTIGELASHPEEEVRGWSDREMKAFKELAELVRELGLRFGMKRKQVEVAEITEAMEIERTVNEYYLDCDTGEVVVVPEEIYDELLSDTVDPDDMSDWERDLLPIARAAEEDSNRYAWIPTIEAGEMYELMQRFTSEREDAELQRLLEVALDGKGAFGRFRRVIADYPEEREEWFRKKDDALQVMARDWLSSLNADKKREDMAEYTEPEVLKAASRAGSWSADVVTIPSEVRTHTGQMMATIMITGDGFVLDASAEVAPSPEPEQVSDLLEQGLRRVAERVGNWPHSVVVRHGEVAEHLGPRLAHLGVQVLHSPILPDIEEATSGLRSHLGGDLHPQIHFGPMHWRGWHRPDAWITDFFHAAARFHTSEPWLMLPPDMLLEAEGTSGRTWYVHIAEGGDTEEVVAPVISLFTIFHAREQLRPETVKEIETAGWPVASPKAWPTLLMINTPAGGLTARDSHDLLAILTIIPEAVSMLMSGPGMGNDGVWKHPESGLDIRLLPLQQAVDEDLFVDAGDRYDISPMLDRIKERAEIEGATSIEDINRIAAEENQAYNSTPQEELGGLNPEQATRLLHTSWENPESPLRFGTDMPLSELKASPMLCRSRILLNAILDRGGIQPTQAGNLTRAFVHEMLVAMGSPRPDSDRHVPVTRMLNEQDTDLYPLRTFLEFAGCIRRYRKKFVVARSIRPLLIPERAGELLQHLFINHFQKLDLSCLDYRSHAPIFQFGLCFALWKFRDLSEEWLPPEAFIDHIILPTIREDLFREVQDEDELKRIIENRLMKPLEEFGLAEGRTLPDQDRWLPLTREYRSTPLAGGFLRFDFNQPDVLHSPLSPDISR